MLDTYNSDPAIFEDTKLPGDFTGDKSILVYQTKPNDLIHSDFYYNASCRAATYGESRAIASQMITDFNRYSKYEGCMKLTLMMTIPPQDNTDNYNTMVEINYISE